MPQLENIEAIEKRLWSSADNLRANSNYASNEYFLPVMGLIFLRHAYSRYLSVKDKIESGLPKRRGKTRPLNKDDFLRKGSIFLRPESRFDYLVNLPDSEDRAQAIVHAMESIEKDYEALGGILPRGEYQELDNNVLGQLLRTFNDPALKQADGDVFGRIYEYFLTQFADLKAHDNGEFFTPVSLVQMIVNMIEPEHGTVLDPASGSGGMFVQSAHFIERMHKNPQEQVTFYGMEKNPTTIRLARMNLAVHGLEGDIRKAITYYEDPHELVSKADFVMANPPFNVDEIDADIMKTDPRMPFGLPGVNKKKKISNGNYVWISFFYSYLNENGRAGFVMSSQASSAGRDEAKVRQKLVETGHMDVMIAIRPNFFYTRAVPCELWFIDRGKSEDFPDQPSPPAPLPVGEGSERQGQYRGGYEFSGLVKRAMELRKKETPAEELFWQLVRNRKFMGFKFRRQHQFGDYIVDFYCHECKTVVELDGPVHDRDKRKKADKKRDAYLESQGLQVIRIKNEALLNNPEIILQEIAALLPSPSGRGAGGEGQSSRPLNSKSNVLMIDARNIYRKVTRKINDFSPEQLKNLSSIVWLYRGQPRRFLELVRSYLEEALTLTEKLDTVLSAFKTERDAILNSVMEFIEKEDIKRADIKAVKEAEESVAVMEKDGKALLQKAKKLRDHTLPNLKPDNRALHKVAEKIAFLAESCRELIKEIDLVHKSCLQLTDTCEKELNAKKSGAYNGRDMNRTKKALDEAGKKAVELIRQVRYFFKQARWLQERFPDARLRDVEGLVKLVSVDEIRKNDWSLTPGRYVGVAPEEEDEDFDFEETMREIHVELLELNLEAADLSDKIQRNFEELMG